MGDAKKFPIRDGDVGLEIFDDYGALAAPIH
jgi:hypothetical protein